jgi:hypothetical protein
MEATQPASKQPASKPTKLMGAKKPRTQITRQSAGHTCDRYDMVFIFIFL